MTDLTDPTDPGKRARHLHEVAASMDMRHATVASIHDAYARRLTEYNRTHLLAGGAGDVQNQDPRDMLTHVLALAAGMHSTGQVPSMSLVEALGAQVLALGLAVARVEDGRFDSGGNAA